MSTPAPLNLCVVGIPGGVPRVVDLNGPEPMSPDEQVLGPDGKPLGWADGLAVSTPDLIEAGRHILGECIRDASGEDVHLPGWVAAEIVAEYDRRGTAEQRLRDRTHEIQAAEMAKRSALDSELAEWRQRYESAKRWTEDAGLRAEWASGTWEQSPFWGMTSYNARSALMRLVAERDEARAEIAAARSSPGAPPAHEFRSELGGAEAACSCGASAFPVSSDAEAERWWRTHLDRFAPAPPSGGTP